jgi:hypothetical protein
VLRSFLVRLVVQRAGVFRDSPQTRIGFLERLFMFYMDWVERSTAPDPPADPEQISTTQADAAQEQKRGEPELSRVVERLVNIQNRTGIPVVIVRLEFDDSKKSDADFATEERVRSLGLRYIDTRNAFAGTRPSDFWIFEFDPHPNSRAHEIFAQVIATFLRENDLLPE